MGYPISLIISLAANLVKHSLPKFFYSGDAGWDCCINYTKYNDADNRTQVRGLFLAKREIANCSGTWETGSL